MKNKLIELLEKVSLEKDCPQMDEVADYLLANGVIVLPFPIGTPYYRIVTKRAKVGLEYFKVIRRAELNWYNVEAVLKDFGKTVFLTREEAEKALAKEKKATYTVTAKNGQVYKWSFTEHKDESDYGNGVYIHIDFPSGDTTLLDCRYMIGYKFHKACVEYLLNYYGDNYDELYEEDLI